MYVTVRYGTFISYLIVVSVMQEVRNAIMQDMQIAKKHSLVHSSVSSVECYVCGKGLQDGHSITARTLKNGIVLFCDVHYSMQ